MHEFGIATTIIETVSTEASRLGENSRITKVHLLVGDLSGVDADALQFSFETVASASGFPALKLDIERLPHKRRCDECTHEFAVDVSDFDASCPSCANLHTVFTAGDELEIAYLEVEDD